MPTASQTSNLSVFAGVTGVYTGSSGGRNLGITAGGDLAIGGFFGFRPAVEVRGTYPVYDGTVDYQKSILAGVRVERPIRRFHPYGDFLIGRGEINYVNAHIPSISIPLRRCIRWAAGLEYDLTRHFAVRGDWQAQHWDTPCERLGNGLGETNDAGVTYRFDFNHHTKHAGTALDRSSKRTSRLEENASRRDVVNTGDRRWAMRCSGGRPGPRSGRRRRASSRGRDRGWDRPRGARPRMTSRLRVGSIWVTPALAGRRPERRARTVARASTAPVAPMAWPCRPLVELTGMLGARLGEGLVDGGGLDRVVGLGAGAVGVDVADLRGLGVGVGERLAHGHGGSGGLGLGDVGGVGGHAEADDLAIDGGVAGERGVEGLDGQHGGALAEGHAVAVGGEGAAAGGGDDADAVPGAQEAPGEGGLVAAGDGGGGHAAAHHLEGEADGVGGRGAGGGEGEDGAGDAEVDGDVAGAGAGHGAGDGERVDAGVAVVELGGLGLFGGAAAGGAAEDDGDVCRRRGAA